MKLRVLTNYSFLTPDELANKVKEVLQGMTGNARFPNPVPSMDDYGTMIVGFGKANTEASTGSKLAIAQRITLQKELLANTASIARYVNFVAEGNLDDLTSSRLTLTKVPQPRIIANPANLRILQGTRPGSLICRVNTVKGATGYRHQYTPHPITKESEWISEYTSRCKFEFEGLEQGKMYWFRVMAIGSNDQQTYSDEVSQYVMQRGMTAGG